MKGEIKNCTSSINDKYCLKLLNINCRSLRSMDKRAQLAALLSYYDIDIVLGCESHIDQSFLSSEILPNSYKIIRKVRSLGGGGVFIGFKQSLELSEVTLPATNEPVEMIWGKLLINNHKSLYLCSFYRPPDGNSSSIIELNNFLTNLCTDNLTNPLMYY